MEVNHTTSSTYSVVEQPKGRFQLIKIVGNYDNQTKAFEDMYKIMTKKITEEEVEKRNGEWNK